MSLKLQKQLIRDLNNAMDLQDIDEVRLAWERYKKTITSLQKDGSRINYGMYEIAEKEYENFKVEI